MAGETAVVASGMPVGDIITQFGFAGLIFIAFMFLLKWVLKHQDNILASQLKILDDSKTERANWQTIMIGYQKTIEQTSAQASEFHKQVTEAHNYQREEHAKTLEGLNTLCITVRESKDCLNQIKENLGEQGKVLARINGFKNEH